MPADAPRTLVSRWSWGRIVRTGMYSLIGLVVGFLLPPIVFLFTMLFGTIVIRMAAGAIPAVPWPAFGIAALIALGVIYAMFSKATEGTCAKSPVAPLGVAIGAGLGSAPWIVISIVTNIKTPGVAQVLATGAFFAVIVMITAALRGGRRGLLGTLGTPQRGVGVLCARCGYDLIATPHHKPCPECGDFMRYPRATPGRHEPAVPVTQGDDEQA